MARIQDRTNASKGNMKPTYEQLEKSRNSWKNFAEVATMYLKVIYGGDADRNLLISEIAKLSEWNTKHIEENDKLKLEIAELEQALTGRTMSCVWCNDTAKQRDELIEAVQTFVRLNIVRLNKGTHGRQWIKAMDNMCRLANVKP